MKTINLTLAQIGNSRGIRLPSALIQRYGLERGLILEDRGHEIALIAKGGAPKLSWEETAREMANSGEDWSEWECAATDGLEAIPWETAKPKPKAKTARKK